MRKNDGTQSIHVDHFLYRKSTILYLTVLIYPSDLTDCFYDTEKRELAIAEYINGNSYKRHNNGTQSKQEGSKQYFSYTG